MYSFEKIVDGVAYTIYFFSSFTGMIQPFTPEDPINANEIYTEIEQYGDAYYIQGWYRETKDGPRLDKIIKFCLLSQAVDVHPDLPAAPGSYYYRYDMKGDKIAILSPISAVEAIQQTHYLRYVIADDYSLISALRIYSRPINIYDYTYNDAGLLLNTKVTAEPIPSKIPALQ